MKEIEVRYLIYDEYDNSIEDINLENLTIAVIPTTMGYLGEIEIIGGGREIVGRLAVAAYLDSIRR